MVKRKLSKRSNRFVKTKNVIFRKPIKNIVINPVGEIK